MSRRLITWAVVCVVLILAVSAVFSGWNRIAPWVPFTAHWNARTLKDRAAKAEDRALSSELESQGQAEQVQRLETVHRQIITVEQSTATAIADARSAPDANEPMEAGANARLYFRDDELCGYAPRLNGCAATNPAGAR